MGRLFVAAWPPEEVLDLIAAWPRPSARGVRWTSRAQWHVTLRFLGEASVGEAAAALAGVRARPTVAVAGPGAHRLARHVLVLPVEGLGEVAAAVVEATAAVGKPPERRRFQGHLTLARLKPGAEVPAGEELAPLSATWLVDKVVLVQSTLSPKGATYQVVTEQALQP